MKPARAVPFLLPLLMATSLPPRPAWKAEGNQSLAAFGTSVGIAGDVNGDGFADVIVGAPNYGNGQADEGRAFVYHGSASGLGTTPSWIAESDRVGAFFGVSVATAGDVNGDGFDDVVVGADFYDSGGWAFAYYGSAAGLSTTPGWTAQGDQLFASFGHSVATAGDVNGDGFDDVVVGAPNHDNGQSDEGRAFIYLGSQTGLATTAGWTAENDQANASFGHSVATAGDVNADGYGDVIVGAFNYTDGQFAEGQAAVYHGSSSGPATSPDWAAETNRANAEFGYSVATAGDVNADGFSDVIVGADAFGNGQFGEGRAFAYYGSAIGLGTTPSWTFESNQANAQLGSSVASAGDLNADGFHDVIVGAPAYDYGQDEEGRFMTFLGSASGLRGSPGLKGESNQVGAFLGNSVGTAGDVSGDGFDHVIVGAHGYSRGQSSEGAAFVFRGAPA